MKAVSDGKNHYFMKQLIPFAGTPDAKFFLIFR